jgi:uncharacterized protein (TIGR00369 family)
MTSVGLGHAASPSDDAAPTTPSQASPRSRQYTWSDPSLSAAAAARMSGLEFLQSIGAGTLARPPALDTLAIDPVEVQEGRVIFEMTPAEWHYNPIGGVHGGVLATLADTALGCAVHSRLPAGTGYSTLEVKLNFVRPVTTATGRIRCVAQVLSLGRRVATADARITDSNGKLYAHATTTCLLFPMETGQ